MLEHDVVKVRETVDLWIAPRALGTRTWKLWVSRASFVLDEASLSGVVWLYRPHFMTGFTQNELKVRKGFPSGDDKENVSGGGLEGLRSKLASKGVETDMYEKWGVIILSRMVVPKNRRLEGLGTEAMNAITEYADASGQAIGLSPSTDFGATSKARLSRFYKGFGFVPNKGRNKDFTISESMIRKCSNPKEGNCL
jgi:hypothetical protein